MKKDVSLALCEKYFSSKNRKIQVTTKDNKIYEGMFIGFFKGDVEWGEYYIIKWHFILFDAQHTEMILEQKNIKSILFRADNSQLKF